MTAVTAAAVALRSALIAAGTTGRAAHRLQPTRPSPAEVAALLREVSAAEAAATARAMAGARYQNRLLVEVAKRGGQRAIARLVDASSVAALRALGAGPVILVGWHVGPPFGILGALEAAGVRALVVRKPFESRRAPVHDAATIDGGHQDRSAAFRAGLTRLEEGGVVLLAADARDVGQTAPMPCFGRSRTMARGPFALARRSGAPLVPVAAQLIGDRAIHIAIGAPLAAAGAGDALEASLATAAAAWVEATVRAAPGQLRRCVLAWLTEGPPLT